MTETSPPPEDFVLPSFFKEQLEKIRFTYVNMIASLEMEVYFSYPFSTPYTPEYLGQEIVETDLVFMTKVFRAFYTEALSIIQKKAVSYGNMKGLTTHGLSEVEVQYHIERLMALTIKVATGDTMYLPYLNVADDIADSRYVMVIIYGGLLVNGKDSSLVLTTGTEHWAYYPEIKDIARVGRIE